MTQSLEEPRLKKSTEEFQKFEFICQVTSSALVFWSMITVWLARYKAYSGYFGMTMWKNSCDKTT